MSSLDSGPSLGICQIMTWQGQCTVLSAHQRKHNKPVQSAINLSQNCGLWMRQCDTCHRGPNPVIILQLPCHLVYMIVVIKYNYLMLTSPLFRHRYTQEKFMNFISHFIVACFDLRLDKVGLAWLGQPRPSLHWEMQTIGFYHSSAKYKTTAAGQKYLEP